MKSVFYNGRVFTGRSGFAQAFAVEDGLFSWVGSDPGAKSLIPAADEAFDLHGRFVCAGFNDSHMHLLNYGQVMSSATLAEHTGSLKELLDCLREHLAAYPKKDGEWLLGRGWNQDCFEDVHRMPTRDDLDSVSRDIPIMITRACGHCCVLNSKALEIAGIDANTQVPDGGSIGSSNGVPDGTLFDNAMDIALKSQPLPGVEELKKMILSACEKLSGFGITSAQTDDYCVFRELPPETVNRAYRELADEGRLTVRVTEQCNFTRTAELEKFISDGNITGSGDTLFRIGPLKLLGDGALGSRTAHLSKPYLNDPQNTGISLLPKETMAEMISLANRNGMQAAVHAIGDACLDDVLDSIESALRECPRRDHRHGIIHCQISRRDQLERMIRLGVHIYAQTVFLDSDNHVVDKLIRPEIASTSYRWRTLIKGGLSVSNGSDCPVEIPDVMRGVQCAVTRRSFDGTGPFLPEEAFTVEEALLSYTEEGAKASFEEDIKGRIESGMLADFVILSGDPFKTKPEEIRNIRVEETRLGGKRVFQKQ